ncbi:MAG: ribosome biogenesis GTPase Der [Planctomycetes bacterium]|nr:ribosome biogenesis GTPase Der [Planctomycetota bacterium]
MARKGRRRLKPPSPEISDGSVRYPFVAIVGRPNVGKSTLFNRLLGHRLAITEPTAGTTRDRIAALVRLEDGRTFELCDMGGLGGTGDPHDKEVNRQIDLAIEYADMILLVVDARAGLTALDQKIARRVLKLGKPTLLVANKADTRDLEVTAAEFYALGIPGEIVCTSAQEGFGRWDLLEALGQLLPAVEAAADEADEADEADAGEGDADEGEDEEASDEGEADDDGGTLLGDLDPDDLDEPDPGADALDAEADAALPDEAPAAPAPERVLRLAIVGRRNVGKSTYVNQILGEQRVIVSEKAGTTRDSVDVRTEVDGRPVVLIDTAGLRKRGRFDDHIEIISHGRALEAVKRCDVAFLVLDALERVGMVDKQLAGTIEREHKACVIVANKWDLVEERMTIDQYADYVKKALPGIEHAPVVAISAKEGLHARAPIKLGFDLFKQSLVRVTTGSLNRALARALERRRPRDVRGRQGKVYFGTQVATNPVTVLLFVNEPELFQQNWVRYLKNQLRRALPWREVPIKVVLRSRQSVARKSGGMAKRLEGMGALAESSRWIDESPTANVRDLAHLLDQEVVRDVLLRTLGRDDEDEQDDDER